MQAIIDLKDNSKVAGRISWNLYHQTKFNF